nr:NUDIX domain-containing protein [Candidatus Gracilibacteria bacterium]
MSRGPEFYSAAYGIFKDKDGKILFMQRQGSGFYDGFYQIPAGHIEGEESVIDCFVREMKEELDVDLIKENLDVVHTSHRISIGRVYFDFYVEVKDFDITKIKINEPNKCSAINFFDINSISNYDEKFIGYDIEIIKMIEKGVTFSEISIKNYNK